MQPSYETFLRRDLALICQLLSKYGNAVVVQVGIRDAADLAAVVLTGGVLGGLPGLIFIDVLRDYHFSSYQLTKERP